MQESHIAHHYKVLVIGGGTGGLGVANSLSYYFGQGDICVVEPSDYHYYQPLWTFVGAGIKKFEESQKLLKDVLNPKVDLLKQKVALINPSRNKIQLQDGTLVGYEHLVISCGIELKYEKVEGLLEAIGKDGVCSNYSKDYVNLTNKFINELIGLKDSKRNVIFTQPSTPIKCAGAPQKIAYLVEEYLREQNKRQNFEILFNSGMDKIFSIEEYANSLMSICKQRNIKVNLSEELVKVDGKEKVATFKNTKTEELKKINYEFLHVTPPMGPCDFIKRSADISDENGYVDVDQTTLVHKRYKNMYALGDCSSLPTSKTAAAAITQCRVVISHILKQLNETRATITEEDTKYDGYTSCPLIVGKTQLIMAEFSGYSKKLMETFPINQRKPNPLMYLVNSKAIPELYWNFYLKGLWHGPKTFRSILQRFKK